MLCNAKSVSMLRYPLNNFRLCSTKQGTSHEIKIPVPWGHIAGKWWGPRDQRPILALHGWQDNCGTFDRLIPLLRDNVGVLAIDLPGHGYSSWLPPGMYYHNMNYPLVINLISKYFNWPKVSLMGHSLGSISSYIYTMIFPETVDFLICIDGLQPVFKKDNGPRMALGIQEHLKYDELARSTEEPPSYSLEEMRQKLVALNNKSISLEHCDHILLRNITPAKSNPNKYFFSRDPRLKARLILNWSRKDLLEGARRVTVPIIAIKFTGSGYFGDKYTHYEIVEVLQKVSPYYEHHYVDGSHHTHLNNPDRIIDLINTFIGAKHVRDGITGDIKNIVQ